jgi:hypothetical protein
MNEIKIKENIAASIESGRCPKHLGKFFLSEIKKAFENNYTLDNLVFADNIYGESDGFVFLTDASKYKTHDFYFVDSDSGLISRWFPAIDINDLKAIDNINNADMIKK